MAKEYSDRAMQNTPPEREFYFPKRKKVIKANSRKEAEEQLKTKKK